MPETTLVGAVNAALGRALDDDETVVVLGEDIGVDGGVFRATEGLLERFGPERVLDTHQTVMKSPLSIQRRSK